MRSLLQPDPPRVRRRPVLVTHDPVEALTLGDRLVLLEEGRVTQIGLPEEIRDRPATQYAADLVGLNLFAGRLEPLGDGAGRLVTPSGTVVVAWPSEVGGPDRRRDGHASARRRVAARGAAHGGIAPQRDRGAGAVGQPRGRARAGPRGRRAADRVRGHPGLGVPARPGRGHHECGPRSRPSRFGCSSRTRVSAVRWGWVIVGAVLVVLGVVWVLQGLNVLKGSVMSDQTFWAWIGRGRHPRRPPRPGPGPSPVARRRTESRMPPVKRTPAPKPNRPRNPDAPPKPRRPRDELGRPLPVGRDRTP